MTRCGCGIEVRKCFSCGAELVSGDHLFAQVEALRLVIGSYAGRTIGDLSRDAPEALEAELKKTGSRGPAQRRLLRDYAMAKRAQDQLRKSAQLRREWAEDGS